MTKFVIKRGGEKEPFDAKKIKAAITAAALSANLPKERVNKVVKQVLSAAMQLAKKKKEIATLELEEKILSELDVLEPSVSGAWRKHKQEKKRV